MRRPFQQQAVFKRAGLHLIGVHDQIFRMRSIGAHRYRAPFLAGRETGSATSAESRLRHEALHVLWRERPKGVPNGFVPSRLLVIGDRQGFFVLPDMLREWPFHIKENAER